MNVKRVLDMMADRAFSESNLMNIFHLYNAHDYGSIEAEYKTCMEKLETILSEEQQNTLTEMEVAYEDQRFYATEFGFKCGIYGAFQQYFGHSNAKDGGFQNLVADDLLMQPKMQRHHMNYKNIELSNKIDADICAMLSIEDKVHLVSISCAWQQRIYSAAVDGFYCGYRAAYDLMEAINPLVKVQNMDKILTTEYHLGYIKPCEEIERQPDLVA